MVWFWGTWADPGRTGSDNRLFVNGCPWVLRSGAHWRDLPERYGRWKTVHRRFSRWCHAGVWERVFGVLTAESFNGRLREELLNETLFRSLPHARAVLEVWRQDYNEERPHSKLGWMTHRDYARTITETTGRNAALIEGSALRPLAIDINDGSDHDRTLAPAG